MSFWKRIFGERDIELISRTHSRTSASFSIKYANYIDDTKSTDRIHALIANELYDLMSQRTDFRNACLPSADRSLHVQVLLSNETFVHLQRSLNESVEKPLQQRVAKTLGSMIGSCHVRVQHDPRLVENNLRVHVGRNTRFGEEANVFLKAFLVDENGVDQQPLAIAYNDENHLIIDAFCFDKLNAANFQMALETVKDQLGDHIIALDTHEHPPKVIAPMGWQHEWQQTDQLKLTFDGVSVVLAIKKGPSKRVQADTTPVEMPEDVSSLNESDASNQQFKARLEPRVDDLQAFLEPEMHSPSLKSLSEEELSFLDTVILPSDDESQEDVPTIIGAALRKSGHTMRLKAIVTNRDYLMRYGIEEISDCPCRKKDVQNQALIQWGVTEWGIVDQGLVSVQINDDAVVLGRSNPATKALGSFRVITADGSNTSIATFGFSRNHISVEPSDELEEVLLSPVSDPYKAPAFLLSQEDEEGFVLLDGDELMPFRHGDLLIVGCLVFELAPSVTEHASGACFDLQAV